MIFTIAIRELKNLFLSPLAWTIMAVLQLILAYLFLSQLDTFMLLQPRLAGIEGAPGVTDIVVAPLLQTSGFLLLLIAPAITMRVFSDERRNRTLSLLLSAPVSMTDIVLGKFLGVSLFFLLLLSLLAAMPLALYAGTTLDAGKLAAGLLGLALLLATFAAIGVFMSSLTEQPVVAAISTLPPVAAVDYRLERRQPGRHDGPASLPVAEDTFRVFPQRPVQHRRCRLFPVTDSRFSDPGHPATGSAEADRLSPCKSLAPQDANYSFRTWSSWQAC